MATQLKKEVSKSASARPTSKKTRKPAPAAKSASSKRPAPAAKKSASSKAPAKAASAKKPARSKKAAPEFEKIAFTMFHVKDPMRARSFYEGVLGFERGLASPDGVWTEYDLPGGGCLALFRHPDPSFTYAPGGASVAFEVRDLDALNSRLKRKGVTYLLEMIHGPACRMSHIADSEGNAIILHEHARKR